MVGALRDLIQFLRLEQTENGFEWVSQTNMFAQVKQKSSKNMSSSKNIISAVGLVVPIAEITIRKRYITLDNALMFRGQHYFITNIEEHPDSRNFYKVTTAAITPKICSVKKRVAELDPVYNRPTLSENTKITFPACVIKEKVKTEEETPRTNTEQSLVIVVPKAITLNVGEQITLGGKVWRVTEPYELDEWKNEYEIIRNDDA